MSSYRFRKSALEGDSIYTLAGDQLIVEYLPRNTNAESQKMQIDLANIQRVKMTFDPTRFARFRFRTSISVAGKATINIYSSHYQGIAKFESRGSEYSRFVSELIAAAALRNPDLDCIKGLGWGGMLGSLLTAVFVLFVLFVGAIYSVSIGLPWIILIKMAFIVLYLPLYIGHLRDNWPGRFDPNQPPDIMLPKS